MGPDAVFLERDVAKSSAGSVATGQSAFHVDVMRDAVIVDAGSRYDPLRPATLAWSAGGNVSEALPGGRRHLILDQVPEQDTHCNETKPQ